ncbi:aldolase catalytic domain-containing protein [uncultured Neptuniibacter sp.]|uniref:aldolase catalytic domain-containing protein n=1 Tax=uncultured Neptuniibacter sp. TaxID=502143 RepID=UPI0026259733|nr:aldolase catalytic domain-containing protein [uncultured Neptuniibacter sp.]
MSNNIVLVDCTLRDGGYYNSWDFSQELIRQYLQAMPVAGVDIVELGFRTTINSSFKGACAHSTDEFLRSLDIPPVLDVSVMVNASELTDVNNQIELLSKLFPQPCSESPVDLVRIACHIHEFFTVLPCANWLKSRGYQVGFNLMQIAERTKSEIRKVAKAASEFKIDVLYFADSMGSMRPAQVTEIISWLRSEWSGEIGIHTHDNLSLAQANTLSALEVGANWVDSTVTGMGRGPGNARTEELAIEVADRRSASINLVPLAKLVREYFKEMQSDFGWGTNSYYYLAGKYSIHPSYIQEMLSDSRYDDDDLMAVINHLKQEGGKKFDLDTLDAARNFYHGNPRGTWCPRSDLEGREVLILGTGPGASKHSNAIENFIRRRKPIVVALNTQREICADLIDYRIACHPVRLLADCDLHVNLPQPLITPYSMLPDDVRNALLNKDVLDFGLSISPDVFSFNELYCQSPSPLVISYALATATSGHADKIFLAGFDGFHAADPRCIEMQRLLSLYQSSGGALPLIAITPTLYSLPVKSVYAL